MPGLVNRLLSTFDLRLSRHSKFISPAQHNLALRNAKLAAIQVETIENAIRVVSRIASSEDELRSGMTWCSKSRSQLGQDLFALLCSNFKVGGFFIEVGATDGVSLSNTFLLENSFGWSGLLVEPEKSWHSQLKQNRKVSVDTRALWSRSDDELEFVSDGVLSSLSLSGNRDMHVRQGPTSTVKTVTLEQLVLDHNCPTVIDYLSIDTEGSELEILRGLPGPEFVIRSISVEHNYSASRIEIFKLLTEAGYVRVAPDISKFDDFYILGPN